MRKQSIFAFPNLAVAVLMALTLASESKLEASPITGVTVSSIPIPSFSTVGPIVDGSGLNVYDVTGIHDVSSGTNSLFYTGEELAAVPVITFNLNGNYDLMQIAVWNALGGFTNSTGFNAVTLEYSQDGVNFSPLLDVNNLPITNFLQGGTAPQSAEVFNVAVAASHIRLTVGGTYGPVIDGARLSEIMFVGEVPEPSTIVIMGLGLGTIAFVRRRKR